MLEDKEKKKKQWREKNKCITIDLYIVLLLKTNSS